MTAYSVTDTVSVDNVVTITGSVAIDNIALSASFNVSVPTSVNQGTGSVNNPWWITTSGSLPVAIASNSLFVSASAVMPTTSIGQVVAGSDRAGKVQYLPILSGGLPKALGYNAVRTFVSASMTDVLLLSGNINRTNVVIYNDSNSLLYIGFGQSPVTPDDFTTSLASYTERTVLYEFKGELRGVWQSSTGVARITEIT